MGWKVDATGVSAVRRVGWLFASVALGLSGCESNPLKSMKFYPVKGKVLLADGKPLTAGRIVFVAKGSSLTSPSTIESDGTFNLKGNNGDGLPVGDYRIRIEYDDSNNRVSKGIKTLALPFSQKYLDEDASDLKATVTTDEVKNNFEFKLSKS
jgi:hypothetical protein